MLGTIALLSFGISANDTSVSFIFMLLKARSFRIVPQSRAFGDGHHHLSGSLGIVAVMSGG